MPELEPAHPSQPYVVYSDYGTPRTTSDIVAVYVSSDDQLERVYLGAAEVESRRRDSSVPLGDGTFREILTLRVRSDDHELHSLLRSREFSNSWRNAWIAWGETFVRITGWEITDTRREVVARVDASNAVPAHARTADGALVRSHLGSGRHRLHEIELAEPSPPEPGHPWIDEQIRTASDHILDQLGGNYTTVRI